MESERTEEKVQKIIERFGLGNVNSEKEIGASENKSESCVHVFEFGEEGKPVEIMPKVESESVKQTSSDEVSTSPPVRELKNNQNKEFIQLYSRQKI